MIARVREREREREKKKTSAKYAERVWEKSDQLSQSVKLSFLNDSEWGGGGGRPQLREKERENVNLLPLNPRQKN